MKKTKIVCTIGPASSGVRTLQEMAKSGMNVARINMSHGTYEEHLQTVQKIKQVRDLLGVSLGIMIDLKGPEIRIGEFEKGFVELKKGQNFCLCDEDIVGDEQRVAISSEKLARHVLPNQKLLLSDGTIELTVKKIEQGNIFCKVKEGGILANNKSISVPGVLIPMKYLSDVDKLDILFGISEKMDFLAISFVQSAKDVEEVRAFLNANGAGDVQIVAKIESERGVKNMAEIIEAADGVMVARGDLGVEVDFFKLPHIQKQMLACAKKMGKFSITATQMLESMIENSRPTRAEVTDVANAVIDGSGAVMLSGETAVGVDPARCVKTMNKIVSECEKNIDFEEDFERFCSHHEDLCKTVCQSAVSASFSLSTNSILVVTNSGKTARCVSNFRPSSKILGCTPNKKTFEQMSILFGVEPLLTTKEKSIEKILEGAVAVCKDGGHIKSGELIVQTLGSAENSTNTVQIQTIK